jgi:hypothetical protein
MSELCVVCHAQPGPVCPDDQKAIDKQLTALPQRLAQLATALIPGQAEAGERVAVSNHVHAGLPLRVDALSLLAAGTSEITVRLHPLVRHWSAKRKVLVTTHVVGHARTVEVEVTDWFHEAVIGADGRPVLVPADDDQVGPVPPREWLDQQVRQWRSHFGHHVPARTLLPRRDLSAHLPGAYRTLLSIPGGERALAFLAAAHTVGSTHARLAHFGLLGYEDPGARSLDPVLDEIERRSGPASVPYAVQWDIDYLRTWLAKACGETALDLGAFAAQLHALHAEIGRVLGDTPDQQWIGRCPSFIAELDSDGEETGRKKPCGGSLWAERFAAQTVCPRCGMTWDVRGSGGAGTAREIRRVWPVDRRRRYTAADIDRLTAPKCPGCGKRVKIEWREVTGTRDKERTWQPTNTSCSSGCDEARRVV